MVVKISEWFYSKSLLGFKSLIFMWLLISFLPVVSAKSTGSLEASFDEELKKIFPMVNRGMFRADTQYDGCQSMEENYRPLFFMKKREEVSGKEVYECNDWGKREYNTRYYILVCPVCAVDAGIQHFSDKDFPSFGQCVYESIRWLRDDGTDRDRKYDKHIKIPKNTKYLFAKDLEQNIKSEPLEIISFKEFYRRRVPWGYDKEKVQDPIDYDGVRGDERDFMEYYAAKGICLEKDSSFADQHPYLKDQLELFLPDEIENNEQCEQQTAVNFRFYEGGKFYRRAKRYGSKSHLKSLIQKMCSDVLAPREQPLASEISCENMSNFQLKGHGSIVLTEVNLEEHSWAEYYRSSGLRYTIHNNAVLVRDITRLLPDDGSSAYDYKAILSITPPDTELGRIQFAKSERSYQDLNQLFPLINGQLETENATSLPLMSTDPELTAARHGFEQLAGNLNDGLLKDNNGKSYANTPVAISCWKKADSIYPTLQLTLLDPVNMHTIPRFKGNEKTDAKGPDTERMGNINYSFKLPASSQGFISFTVEPVEQ